MNSVLDLENYIKTSYVFHQDLTEDYSQRNVPIWLALSLVIAYIVGGAFIFQVQSRLDMAKAIKTAHNFDHCRSGRVGPCWIAATSASSR